jgi:hypothetical protein
MQRCILVTRLWKQKILLNFFCVSLLDRGHSEGQEGDGNILCIKFELEYAYREDGL